MSTTLSISEQIEQVLLEEGSVKSAVVRRFNKMAGLFSQSNGKAPWDYTTKTQDQKRLAYAGFILSKFALSIKTDKRNKTAGDVVFSMSDLGRVTSALDKALKAEGATFDSVKKAYEVAVSRLDAKALRDTKAKVASGDATKALLSAIKEKLSNHKADFVKSTEADDDVAAIEALLADYKAIKVMKAITITQSEPALINA
jgi:Tol biopolymer transport system component